MTLPPTHNRAYVACGFADRALYARLDEAVTQAGWVVSYRWPDFPPPTDPIERRQYRTEQSVNEINAASTSDVLIVGLPGGYGTASELGAALSAEVPVILFGHISYVGADPINIFLEHPGIAGQTASIPTLVHMLRTMSGQTILERAMDHLRLLDLECNAKLSPPSFAADRKDLLAQYDRMRGE